MASLNFLYARWIFKSDTNKRMGLYHKIASLLHNNFTLMNALDRCWQIESKDGTKKDEPFAIVLRAWQDKLERGSTFGEAVHWWVPENEELMLAASDVSKLSTSLDNIAKVSGGISKIKKAFFDALSYPMFLFAATFAIIIMVGIYLVPPLSEAAGGNVIWHGTAAMLVMVAKYSDLYWIHAIVVILAIFLFMWWSLANLAGKSRIFLDRLPPWNMYKSSVSVSWLMSLAAIVSGGSSLMDALKMLSDSGNPYLRANSLPAEHLIENGYNLGQALSATGRHFPNDEIIGDLEIYADMNDFSKNLFQIANDYMENSVRTMERIASILNSVGILLVSVVIMWVVFGTFDMQEQITTALS